MKSDLKLLTSSAINYGLDRTTVAEILAKWGPPILKLVVDGLAMGLTWDLMREVLEVLGETWLRDAVAGMRRLKAVDAGNWEIVQGMPVYAGSDLPAIIEGERVEELDYEAGVIKWIIKLLPTVLPKMLEDPEVMKKVLEVLLEILKSRS